MEIIRLVYKSDLRKMLEYGLSIVDLIGTSCGYNPKTESGYDRKELCEIKITIPDKENTNE